MEIDQEIKNLIDEYVKQVENKEDDLVGFKRNIDGITSMAKADLKNVIAGLDLKFDANEISEEEYLVKIQVEKENILEKVKEKLGSLIGKYELMYN